MVISSEFELEEYLSRPHADLVSFIRQVSSPLVILGAGGKMGPTLAVLAQRAARQAGYELHIVAVSRFSDPAVRLWLEDRGIETVASDLLDPDAMARLPDAADVVYLVGQKFGTGHDPGRTWAVNTIVPWNTCRRYAQSRIVALSTGNVYPLVAVSSGGSRESDRVAPVGEYAQTALARERLLDYCSRNEGTRIAILRLNYAVELRYGVLLDIALRVWQDQPIDTTMGHFHCIWQGDANAWILQALELASNPPAVWNITGPTAHSVRQVAEEFGKRLGHEPRFTGCEAPTALLSDASQAIARLGPPRTPCEQVIAWTADWVRNGCRTLDKPTHFEVRDGQY